MSAREAQIAAVLAEHWWSQRCLSMGSSDRCACGAKTLPERGEEDVSVRRARAFAAHQAAALDAALGEREGDRLAAVGAARTDEAAVPEMLAEAIKDTLWRVEPYGETDDGDIAFYLVTKGTVHRLVAAAQSAGINAAFRNTWAPVPAEHPTDEETNQMNQVDTDALRRAVAESRAPSLWVQDGQDAVLALCDEVESLRGALDTALGLAERWNGSSATPGHSYLEVCAAELLQALSPIVLPVIEAQGVVPWPDHAGGAQGDPAAASGLAAVTERAVIDALREAESRISAAAFHANASIEAGLLQADRPRDAILVLIRRGSSS